MWTKLDDGFYDHPKVLGCSLEAIGLHALALSYCGRHCTGGETPRNAPFLQGRTRFTKELVRAMLWEQTPAGWRIHDWSDFNPTADEARDYQRRMRDVRRQGGKVRAATASRVAGRFVPAPTSKAAGTSKTAGRAHQPRQRPVPSTKVKEKDQDQVLSHGVQGNDQVNGQGVYSRLSEEQQGFVLRWVQTVARATPEGRPKLILAALSALRANFQWTEDQARQAMFEAGELLETLGSRRLQRSVR